MSAAPGNWSLVLANTADMSPIGLLRYASSKQLQLVYNRPGTLNFQVPIDDGLSYSIVNRKTCVIAYRNDVPVWSAPVVSVRDAVPEDVLQVTCMGWLEELDHRFIRPSEEPGFIFSNIAGGQIILALIAAANAQTDGNGVVRPTHVKAGVATDTQVRSRAYKRAESYGDNIRELCDVENGCDIFIDPISRSVTVRSPTDFADRLDCRFGYGIFPNNLETVSRQVDGTRMANRINVAGASSVTPVFAESQASMDDADTIIEEWITLSDVTQASVLGEYANGEVAYKKDGLTTYAIKPMSLGTVPRLFDDFQLGDKVYFSVDRGRFRVDTQPVRVFTASLTISDDTGDEIFDEIGTSPSS
jgi:hypothetical protein